MKLFKNLLKTPAFIFGGGLFVATLLLAFVVPIFMHIDPRARVGLPYEPPSAGHWLGTDHMGVDMLHAVIAGLQSSL
jgi:peptide/nickel transport system permease protein